MWDTIGAIHKALGIESTWKFVLIIAFGAGVVGVIVGGFVAWIVDVGYKNSDEYKADHSPKTPTVAATPIDLAPQSVTVQQNASSQGVQSATSTTSHRKQGKPESLPTQAAAREPAGQAQPTYSVTNPQGSIVNQNSPNYGDQTVIHNPPFDPNAPVVTWFENGERRVVTPGNVTGGPMGPEVAAFGRMKELAADKKWQDLLALSNDQIKQFPKWLTPYYYAGWAQANLQHLDESIDRLKYVEEQAKGNADYGNLSERAHGMREKVETVKVQASKPPS
jgi:hypothetical protein